MTRLQFSNTILERSKPVGCMDGATNQPHTVWRSALALPPNVFSITMGLAGLAGVWQLASKFFHIPLHMSASLYLATTLVYLVLGGAFVGKMLCARQRARTDLTHPVLGPFNSLFPISGMLLALGLEPYVHHAALVLFLALLMIATLLGVWMVGYWLTTRPAFDQLHSGYYLPTVAVGLIGADGLARFGFVGLAWAFFVAGMLSWLITGPIILTRLATRPALPQKLIPTLAIEVAPAALAGSAYFSLTGGRIDVMSALFAGYALLAFLVQLCLVPTYRKLPFAVTFWSFTFPFAAFTAYMLRWLHFGHLINQMPLAYVLLAAITLLIGGIALRSLGLLKRNNTPFPDIATS